MRIKIIYLLVYTLADICFSMFFETNTILIQTFFNIGQIVIYLMVADLIFRIIEDKAFKSFMLVFLWYWIGAGSMFIINMFIHSDLESWYKDFNNYAILVSVYTFTILAAVIHIHRVLK